MDDFSRGICNEGNADERWAVKWHSDETKCSKSEMSE
jgi:hypothetical protein